MTGVVAVVDAGGTSTRAAIADARGRIVARSRIGAGSFSVLSLRAWTRRMCEALEACANEAPITRAWIGSAGIDADESARIATEALRCAMPHVHEWTVTNDAALLCASVPRNRPCVVCIAGTGSVVLAYDAQRTRTKRVGGLGWLLGDEGSAVGVGRAALRHVLSEPSPLLDVILAATGAASADDLLSYVYTDDSRTRIAALAQVVTRAAHDGHAVAQHIVELEAQAMAACIDRAAPPIPAACRLGGALFGDAGYLARVLHHVQTPFIDTQVLHDICGTAAQSKATRPW